MRTYELMYILDPRVSEEELMSISSDVKELLTAKGGQVLREEHWGRRKLAYEIEKLKEGKYILLYLAGDPEELNIQEVEYRMRQNDNILRYLTVRTDEDLRRAGQPLPTEQLPTAREAEPEGEGEAAESAEAETSEKSAEAESAEDASAEAESAEEESGEEESADEESGDDESDQDEED